MTQPEGTIELELCRSCWSMTWTMNDGTCGKCHAEKRQRRF